MNDDDSVVIEFPRRGFIHPNLATYWRRFGRGSFEKDYEDEILRIHHLACMFPTIDYGALTDVVQGKRTLTVLDDDDHFGVRISVRIDEEE